MLCTVYATADELPMKLGGRCDNLRVFTDEVVSLRQFRETRPGLSRTCISWTSVT